MLGLSFEQTASLAIIVGVLAALVLERWRYDLVALVALLVAVASGVVPAEEAFLGFSDSVIVIIASVLVIGRAIAQSGLLDRLLVGALVDVRHTSLQVAGLAGGVALLSAFVKNVGALGILIPVAIQVARRSKISPSVFLMPLAFGSLIGGTITQIGTSPNLLVSSLKADIDGGTFGLFDFAWVGLPLTVLVIAFLSVGWRLLPTERKAAAAAEEQFEIDNYTTELAVSNESALVGKSIGDVEKLAEGVVVVAILREGGHHYIPSPHWPVYAGDILTVQGNPAEIKTLLDTAKLDLEPAVELPQRGTTQDELRTLEGIVSATSPLVGQSPGTLSLRRQFDVNVLAVSTAGQARAARLQEHRFRIGDVVVLQGWEDNLREVMTELGLLPLADRKLTIGSTSRGFVSISVLAVSTLLITLQLVSPAIGFLGAAVTLVGLKQVSMKEAYESIDGSVLILLAALMPIAKSLQTTGVTDIAGTHLAGLLSTMPGFVAVGAILLTAMLATPFLNNAAAVLMLGPVAAFVSKALGYGTDPFLMAVALGCACDFLTPIGHQNNMLVMTRGGYRFGDYWRLGLPISLIVLVAGTALIIFFWPLQSTGHAPPGV